MKIYIICGKARSGKTTVAEIIKNIYEEKNIKVLNLMYSEYLKNYARKILNWNGLEETKPREFLQKLGTDIRNEIDENFFVKRLMEDIDIYKNYYNVFTISDTRYANEIETPKEKYDVTTIYVRTKEKSNLSEKEKAHITENALNNYDKFDYYIDNDFSKEELKETVKKIVKEVER